MHDRQECKKKDLSDFYFNIGKNVGLQVEQLPIRYLRLPLTIKKMTTHDYSP
ncbi:unnamed protein product, partial [Arabidopsis halleri]